MHLGFCVNEASRRLAHGSLHGHHAMMAPAPSHYTLRAHDAEDEDADPTAGIQHSMQIFCLAIMQ